MEPINFRLSNTRGRINQLMEEYADRLKLKRKKILEIGTAGDPIAEEIGKPAGNYRLFGKGNTYKTMDILKEVTPDYQESIVDTTIKDNEFDLVICSQVLEHIWNYPKAIREMYRILKPGGYLILDTPWQYPHHPEEGFKDYWRFSEDAYNELLSIFKETEVRQFPDLVSALARK